jgi:hypothetical protein
MAAAQQRRQNAPRPRLSLQEIGAGSYGSSLRSIRQEGSMVLLEFAPKQEGTPPQNFRRIFGTATGVIPALFASDRGIQSVRLTALDASRPDRRLVVFSVTRADSEKMDWQRNVTTERILKTVKTEYLDPEFRSLAAGQKGG